MTYEMRLDKSVKLSGEQLDEISGGPSRRPYDHYIKLGCAHLTSYINSNGIYIQVVCV